MKTDDQSQAAGVGGEDPASALGGEGKASSDGSERDAPMAKGGHAEGGENGDAPANAPANADNLLAFLPRGSFVDASGRVTLGPGAYHVAGPNFTGEGHQDASSSQAVVHGGDDEVTEEGNDGEIVIEGFVPEPTDDELREERLRAEAEEMLRSAVALDPSAVRVIDDFQEEGPGKAEGGAIQKLKKSPQSCILLTVMLLSAIGLGVAFGGGGDGAETVEETSQPPQCTIDSVRERYDAARSIVSAITAPEVLDDDTTPQARALEWLVCEDGVSTALIDGADDPYADAPVDQSYWISIGGESGDPQVLRRYALATFFYATSEDGPWRESLNFLSGDRHECMWHENKTRTNRPFGKFDPVGFFCRFKRTTLNFRIPNNLTGSLPPEIGCLDATFLALENQRGLRGSLPTTLGNFTKMNFMSILYNGPELGGTIPASIFTIPKLRFMTFLFNEGVWALPEELPSKMKPKRELQPAGELLRPIINLVNVSSTRIGLINLSLRSTGLTGTLPGWISTLKKLELLELGGNSLEGTVPDSYGDLASLDYLNLDGNNLNGTLPSWLGQLKNMTFIFLGNNNFQGPLPTSLGDLEKLRLLDLSHNQLEGTVPDSFSKLANLEHISLQNNSNLWGSIAAFESLPKLSSLALYGNRFSSTIPADLFSRSAGRSIIADLGHNNFTGGLPRALSQQASNTSYLSIMRNQFDDDIVDDAICDEVRVVFADCNSCTCCQFCCDESSVDRNDNCNFDLDFYDLVGLEYQCIARGTPGGVCPLSTRIGS